jgi:hypothetical protein
VTFVAFVTDLAEKARRRKSAGRVIGASDSSIVPKKQANKGSALPTESVEGRELTDENAQQSLLDRTQRRAPGSRGLLDVREAASRDRQMPFNNLLHHVTAELLQTSFLELQAAPGIDGVTWVAYAVVPGGLVRHSS